MMVVMMVMMMMMMVMVMMKHGDGGMPLKYAPSAVALALLRRNFNNFIIIFPASSGMSEQL